MGGISRNACCWGLSRRFEQTPAHHTERCFHFPTNLSGGCLALQLQFHLKMRLLGGGLMRSSPEGPSDNARWLDALLREPYGYAANFLKGPADKRRATKIWGIVCCVGIVLARCRIVAVMAKASMTSETWRFHPCQERVSL